MSGVMLQTAWKENGIQKPFTHLCHSSKKGKKECALKEQKKQQLILFSFFFFSRFSLHLLPFFPLRYQEERTFCTPLFCHHSPWGGRSILWLCVAVRYLEMLGVLLSRKLFFI